MCIVAEDPVSGSLVKLPGSVTLSATGQITTTFDNNPQLPFSDLKLYFFGGERVTLATPAHCGTYTTNVSLAPCGLGAWREVAASWSGEGAAGSACSASGFASAFTAGTSTNQAGGYSPFVLKLTC